MTLPAMVMYVTSCVIFCVVVIILLTCKVMGLMDSDPGQRLTPARFYRKRRVKVFECFYT